MEKYTTLDKISKLLEEASVNPENVEKISKQMLTKGCQELQLCFERFKSDPSVLLDLLNSLNCLVQHNRYCIQTLKEHGILQFMKVVFQQVISWISVDRTSDMVLNIVELLTGTTNVLAEASPEVKSSAVIELSPLFWDILIQPLNFMTRLEVLKTNNFLLEQCPIKVKEELLNNEENDDKIHGMVRTVLDIGDYEFQVGVIEFLMRLFPRKQRQKYASMFIQDRDMLNGFLSIKDKDFEIDCRLFLNNINIKAEDPTQGVFSLPCVSAFIGNKELRKPNDDGYEEFWVDFNIGSKRITLFCEQSSLCSQASVDDMWETVAIYQTDMKKYTCEILDDLIVIEISLKQPVCDIYPSQHMDVSDNKIWLKFDSSLEEHISHAVMCTFNFNEKRSKSSEVIQPLKISMSDVAKANAQVLTNHQPSGSTLSNGVNIEPTPVKHCRASVPAIPMTPESVSGKNSDKELSQEIKPGPLVSNETVKNKGMSAKVEESLSSKKNHEKAQPGVKDFKEPLTPQKKTRSKKKVKTPVVTVTPPPKKEQSKERTSKSKSEELDLAPSTIDHESDEVIPDSLPQENVSEDVKVLTNTNANNLKKNDSGIESDISLSKTLNDMSTLEIIPEEGKENSPITKKNTNKSSKDINKKSRTKAKHSNSIDAPLEELSSAEKNEDKDTELVSKDKLDLQEKQEVETFSAKKLSDVCFGFESLIGDENIECIPDSSENQTNTVNSCTDVPQNMEKVQPNISTEIKKPKQDIKDDKKTKCITSDDIENVSVGLDSEDECFKDKPSKLNSTDTQKGRNKKGKTSQNQDTTVGKISESGEENAGKDKKSNSLPVVSKKGSRKKGRKNDKKCEESFQLDNDTTGRSLRSHRRNVSYKEVDTSLGEDENLNEENDESDRNDATINDVTNDYLTPTVTPEKDVIEEKKVKSSLKKNKYNFNTDCQNPDRRKSKVSFDLPSSQSQSDVVNVTKGDDKKVSDKREMNDKNDTDLAVNNSDVSEDMSGVIANSIESADPQIDVNLKHNSSNDYKTDNLNVNNNKLKGKGKGSGLNDEFRELEETFAVDGELDSLYIESDDSYNERRYRMEVKEKDRYQKRRSRRSSMKKGMKEKTTKEKDRYNSDEEIQVMTNDCIIKKNHSNESSDDERNEINSPDDNENIRANVSAESCKTKNSTKSRRKKCNSKTNLSKSNHRNSEVSSSDQESDKKITRKGREKRSSEKNKNLTFSYRESLAEIDQMDDSFSLSQQRVEGSMNSGKKKIVFERSYLKSKTNFNPTVSLSKLDKLSKVDIKNEPSYDPYDFFAQCDNSSMASERINRKDISKELNEKYTHKAKTKKSRTKSHHHDANFNENGNVDTENNKPKTSLVQDKKTNKWHRVVEQTHDMENQGKDEVSERKSKRSSRRENDKSVINVDDDNVCYDDDNSCCIVNNFDEQDMVNQNIRSFDKIIKEITFNRMKNKKLLDSFSNGDNNISLDISCEPIMSPFVVQSLSSTPKVGSAGRKHYKPLNISIIKTPQSFHGAESDSQNDSSPKQQKKTQKKKQSSSKSKTTSIESEISGRRKSEMLDDSSENLSSFLDSSHGTGIKSEKSWILDRKKPPKYKDNDKTYKYKSQNNKVAEIRNNSQSEISSDENNSPKYLQSPIAISSICGTTPAMSASTKSVGCLDDVDCNIYSPISPYKSSNQSKIPDSNDIEEEQTQENYPLSLSNMDNDTSKLIGFLNDDSFSGFPLKASQKEINLNDESGNDGESDDDEETSMMKGLQNNLKMHGDSGFMSGPSSEVRPSRSTLKRRFPDVIEDENNILSSSNSQSESNNEEEYSTFIPKKLFKFDPEVALETSKAVSVSSSWNDEPVCFPGLPSSMSAFGADMHKQFQKRKQGIELMTNDCFKETNKYLTQTLVEQQQYQTNLTDNLQAKMFNELKAIEKDIQMLLEAEQKTEDFFKYQISVLQNNEESQRQRLKNMKAAEVNHFEKKRILSKNNSIAHKTMKDNLKHAMHNLQKKLVAEVQKQEFENMKRRLQSFLF